MLTHLGLERIDSDLAEAGDIIAITGLGELNISDTICDPQNVEALPALSVDEPTVTMFFNVNTSPFCGKEGKYVTSRQILDRLNKELVHNVALRVEETEDADAFRVSGRGELHLSVLIENMRREGFEMAVSRPKVKNVRGGDIFIIQSTCAPTNDNLMELVVMVDALRRASAGRITAVIPYFGYARQDRRVRSARVPITAKVVADFLSSVGVDRVLTVHPIIRKIRRMIQDIIS